MRARYDFLFKVVLIGMAVAAHDHVAVMELKGSNTDMRVKVTVESASLTCSRGKGDSCELEPENVHLSQSQFHAQRVQPRQQVHDRRRVRNTFYSGRRKNTELAIPGARANG